MKNNLIGISGKMGSGKDIVGKIIRYLHPEYEIKKFADKLKEGCEYDFPHEFSVKEWETGDRSYRDEIMPSLSISRRDFLLKRGDNRRAIRPHCFVNALFAEYIPRTVIKEGVQEDNNGMTMSEMGFGKIVLPSWLITDVRFPNEAQAIKDRGGIVIRVDRDVELRDHESETALDNYDFKYRIDNNGTIEELVNKIKRLHII